MAPTRYDNAEDALESIRDGENIWLHSMAATPRILVDGLAKLAPRRKNLTLLQLHTERSEVLSDPSLKNHVRHRCFFSGSTTRALVQAGDADYVPIFLSEVPKLFRQGHERVDTALVQVSPPDSHGNCSLGVSVEATRAACEMAGKIIAHINPLMPRTHGDSFLSLDSFDAVIEGEDELPEHVPPILDATTIRIGENVAGLIDDGACLQMGIGAIPDAALACLGDRRDLGIHTEMFSNGLLPLVESGVITGARKSVHPGKIVTGFVVGDRKLYDFVDDNPQVVFLDIEYVNDTATIRRNSNVIAINSALQVDLSGQICADSLGTQIYSGVGGQMDFIRGASLSPGGKAIVALPATAAHGAISRIASTLNPGGGVVTTRAHVHYVVTEFGVVQLHGKSLRERAKALIEISAPEFQEDLTRKAHDDWGLNL